MAVEREFPVKIDVYGFDAGTGLPEPKGYRDLPYIWKAGFFAMDQSKLQERLKSARLVIGDVKQTVPTFFSAFKAAPLAAAMFDLDYWSSTLDALDIFKVEEAHLLPRVFCYFDDVISNGYRRHTERACRPACRNPRFQYDAKSPEDREGGWLAMVAARSSSVE